MKARRFTERGLSGFRDFIEQCRLLAKEGDDLPAVSEELLLGGEMSEEIDLEFVDPPSSFATKLDIARYLDSMIPPEREESFRRDAPFWSWLAAAMFELITCEGQRRRIKETRAYLAGLGFQDFYRHSLLGPYFVFSQARDEPERVRVLLYDVPTVMNEVMVQFGSYQTLMQNPQLQTLIQRLYFDHQNGRIKKGAGGKNAGTPRRLMDYFRQIELNYDLHCIEVDGLWEMLPREFERFKK